MLYLCSIFIMNDKAAVSVRKWLSLNGSDGMNRLRQNQRVKLTERMCIGYWIGKIKYYLSI